ncbi:type I secretion system permease/ATPase [Sulfurimonas sp.]|uniref:peptidase domain-containing ABC transporter n=1 Tax=Sulfurimonas sp. TaxID=2022749 RepID=UPI002B47598E|nr:type I secretion system permease/ATPase [Sulfurimonas sp.]
MHSSLISLQLIGRFYDVPINIDSIINEYAIQEEISIEEVILIGKNEGFNIKAKNMDLKVLVEHYPLPMMVQLKDNTYAVILKANIERNEVVIFYTNEHEPKLIEFEQLDQDKENYLILSEKYFTKQIKFSFSWFYRQILHHKKVMSEVLLASFVIQLFALVTPLFTQVILDKVIAHGSLSTLKVIGIAFITVGVFDFLLNVVRNYVFFHTSSKIDATLGSKLFKHLLSLPIAYFESRQVGNISARVRELDEIRDFIADKSINVLLDLLFSIVFVVVMFFYSVKLTFIVLGIVTLIGLIYLIFTPLLRKKLEEKFQMAAHSNSYLVEAITGVQTVKSLNVEGSMEKKWNNHLAKYVEAGFDLSKLSNILSGFSAFLRQLMTIGILYFGVLLVIDQKLSVGQLIAFQMFANQFIGPILRLVNLWNDLQQALLSVDRVGDILNTPTEQDVENAITLSKLEGDIKFENVNFKYSLNTPNILNNISFTVKSGQTIGLVGRSGSGKSTITKLVQRLYVVNSGMIYMDGVDSRHLNPKWLRGHIGVVLQENFLFSGSIKDNITLSKPAATMDEIIEASTMAGAHEFISEFSEGYDTAVGERGSALSGGQRQRVAIARALITKPKLLIFDEATSALDYESEKIIQDNMKIIKHNRTMLIIAHRLSTVRDCDVIYALDKGEILEFGSHDELMEKEGYYYSLITQQGR